MTSNLPDPVLVDGKILLQRINQEQSDQFTPTASVQPLLAARSDAVDNVLIQLWQRLVDRTDGVALIAVGGYGRAELFPHSDVDVLVLLAEEPEDTLNEGITRFITALWDLGLRIGHSVRTLNEAVELASQDITIVTNIMEARTLIGDTALLRTLQSRVGPERIWSSTDFFRAKVAEQNARHQKYGDTEYALEPNVKSSPGGLRDLQVIRWIAQRHFGADATAAATTNFLNAQERQQLSDGLAFLSKVRFALHSLADREEDRLLFDHQRRLAAMWGYQDGERLAVEQFMQEVYRWLQTVNQLNDLLIAFFEQTLIHPAESAHIRMIDDDFEVIDDRIAARHPDVFHRCPANLLRLFVIIGNDPSINSIDPPTQRMLRAARDLIDDDFRQHSAHRQLFIEILSSPHNMTLQLRRLWQHGLLGRYLPLFGQIEGQMQFDMFHTFTVDAHTMAVIANTRRFYKADYTDRFPVSTRIAQRLRKPVLLYISALFHDIGKGRGGDHSELGAEDVRAFCINHGFDAPDTELVTWLVRNHLVMSTFSQRRDLSDPEEIQQFATHVATEERLDYLYTLTVADIDGTNPELWNAWRGSLLRQLYAETRRAIRRGLSNPLGRQEVIAATRRAAAELLEYRGFFEEDLATLWATRGDDYFLRERPEDIAWHTEAIANHEDMTQPLVLVRQAMDSPVANATQIFLHTPDKPQVFSRICAELELQELSINDARIYSGTDGATLDTFFVLRADGSPLDGRPEELEAIEVALTNALVSEAPRASRRRIRRALKSFIIPTETSVTQDMQRNLTVLEIATPDRPGLLARISALFVDMGIIVQGAKIQTLGERVEDVFFLTAADGAPLTDPALIEKMQTRICELLDEPSENNP
jgi:[protein-PII] uridylyltransferase